MKRNIIIAIVVLAIISASYVIIKLKNRESYWINIVTCDFESFKEKSNSTKFYTNSRSNSLEINGVAKSDFAKSGEYSVLVSEQSDQSIISFDDIEQGQLIEFSIWQLVADTGASFKVMANLENGESKKIGFDINSIVKTKKTWKQHFISIPILDPVSSVELIIVTTNNPVHFDDFTARIYPKMPNNIVTETLRLYVPNKSKNKLNKYLDKAINFRVIPESSKKYVKGYYINSEADTFKLEMKIKGDWNDHVTPNKPSFRLKLKDASFLGMTSFSIQHPKTRNYLQEYAMHKMADKEDILTTYYSYVNVIVNDYYCGVYAIEEHFDKHIIENRKRREAPILKFDESGQWEFRTEKINKKNKALTAIPYYEASIIKAFKINKILSNNVLMSQFEEGAKLLSLFKQGHLDIEEIFDIDNLARYYALVEFTGYNHALIWHNRRFYFNPVTHKLEHIYFDALPKVETQESVLKQILESKSFNINHPIVLNEKFKKRYFYHLNKITSPQYLDALFDPIRNDYDMYFSAVSQESSNNKIQIADFYSRAEYLRKNISIIDEIWENRLKNSKEADNEIKNKSYTKLASDLLFKNVSINAYSKKLPNNKYQILIENYHFDKVKIESFNFRKNGQKYPTPNDIELQGYTQTFEDYEFEFDSLPYQIFFTAANTGEKLHASTVLNWSKPIGQTVRNTLNNSFSKNDIPFANVSDSLIEISGNFQIDKMYYIPKQYSVHVLAGSKIEFKTGGGLICNNDFKSIGTAEKPITFYCQDSTSNGITILNAPNGVEITHTKFNGLSNLNYKGWTLTGAVNIYESSTTLSHVTISENTSEDALNIIRSRFMIDNLIIENTTSDGFDADFCTGEITDSRFYKTGNDCIDFSGSNVEIRNIKIIESGDKGVSGGERSNLQLRNIDIDGAIIGIAAKDASIIHGNDIIIKNAITGAASFQKKSTYGPAQNIFNNITFQSCTNETLIENGSKITIDSQLLIGTDLINIDSLYQGFTK